MKIATKHIEPLLLLRAFSIIGIIIYHIQYPGVFLEPILGRDFSWLVQFSFSYVWVFFMLSGYGIGKAFFRRRYRLTKQGVFRFYMRRFLRIAPLYYGVILVIHLIYDLTKTHDTKALWQLITFTAQKHTDVPFTGYLWYLSNQMQMYIFAPILFWILRKVSIQHTPVKLLVSLLIVGTGYLLRVVQYARVAPSDAVMYQKTLYTPLLFNLDFFVFGFSLNLFMNAYYTERKSLWLRLIKHIGRCGIVLGLCGLFIYTHFLTYATYHNYRYFIYAHAIYLPVLFLFAIGAYIVLFEYDRYGEKKYTHMLKELLRPAGVFVLIGYLSYELFVIHPVVMYVLHLQCNDICTGSDLLLRTIIVIAVTLAISIAIRFIPNSILRNIKHALIQVHSA